MKTIDAFNRIKELNEEINKTLERVSEIEDIVTSTTGAMSDMKVKTSPNPERVTEYVCILIDLKNKCDELTDELVDLKCEVCNFMASHLGIDSPEYKVLKKRFLYFQSRTQIAKEIGYTREGVRQIEMRGVKKICEIEKNISEIERNFQKSIDICRSK